jgi:hypothetical protein
MKYLLTGVAAIALLTACGDKNKDKDGASPAGVEISQGKAPNVKLRKGDPASAGAVLSALSLDKSGAGRVNFDTSSVNGAKAAFTDVTIISSADAEEDDADVEFGDDDRLHIKGSDLKAGKLEFEGLGMIDGQANFSRMVLSDVTFVPKEGAEAHGSTKVKSVELVNPSPETAAWIASLFGKGEAIDMPEGKALAFDLWSMDDLNFQIDEEGGDKGAFVIDGINVVGVKDEKVAQMSIKNMTFDMFDSEEDTDVKASLGGIDLRNVNLALLSAADDGPSDGVAKGMVEMLQNDPANPGYDSVLIDNLKVAVSGADFTMPKLSSKVSRDKKGRAVKVVTEPFKMTLGSSEGELGEKLGTQLATLGYEKLELSGQGEQTYDPDKDFVTLVKGKNFLKLENGFKLDYSAKYEGAAAIAKAQAAATDQAPGDLMQDALDNLQIHGFELALADDGFVDRAFNAFAAQSGQDPQQLRSQVAGQMAMAPMMAAGTGIDPELLTELATAFSSIITHPKTLTITLAPATPLKVGELADMEDPSAYTKAALGFAASNK